MVFGKKKSLEEQFRDFFVEIREVFEQKGNMQNIIQILSNVNALLRKNNMFEVNNQRIFGEYLKQFDEYKKQLEIGAEQEVLDNMLKVMNETLYRYEEVIMKSFKAKVSSLSVKELKVFQKHRENLDFDLENTVVQSMSSIVKIMDGHPSCENLKKFYETYVRLKNNGGSDSDKYEVKENFKLTCDIVLGQQFGQEVV